MRKCLVTLSKIPALIDFLAESALCLLAGVLGMGLGLLCLYIAMKCFRGVISTLFE